ncbi:MAG: tetratricopeptide repeat protein [Ignavibacteriales bacterium]
MKRNISLLAAIFFCCISATYAQNIQELLTTGDNYAEEQFNNQKALDIYLQADKLSPNNWDVYWRLSRTYVDIADHMPSSTDAQKEAQQAKYQQALDYAEKSVKLAPDKSVTYIRRAIANGKIALFKGVFSVIGLVNKVKSDAEKAIKLGNGNSYVQAVSHYVLGRTHAKVCEKAYLVRLPLGLGWGNMEVAEAELKKAIEIHPNFRMFYLDLAKVYIENDDYQKAKDSLYKLEKSPKAYQDDDKYLAEARVLLDKIKNR